MKPSDSNIKKFLIFPQEEAFPIFQEMEIPKKLLIFQERKLSYILENGNSEKILYLSGNRNPRKLISPETNFQSSKKRPILKKFLIF